MDILVRKVKKGDQEVLAYIHAQSWREGFKEILPVEFIERSTDLKKSEKMYERLISENIGNGYILEVSNNPHCIAWWDKSREEDMADYAELICIHSLNDNWNKGYGSIMLNGVLEDIKESGYKKVMLWVFEENKRAIKFYEKFGFRNTNKCKYFKDVKECCYFLEF